MVVDRFMGIYYYSFHFCVCFKFSTIKKLKQSRYCRCFFRVGTCPSKRGFPGGSKAKNPPANAGDVGSIPGSGRSPEEGNGNPLQYSCLGNPMDRGAWQVAVHGVTKELNMTEPVNNNNNPVREKQMLVR